MIWPRTHTGSSTAVEIVLQHLTGSFSVVQVKVVASKVKMPVKTWHWCYKAYLNCLLHVVLGQVSLGTQWVYGHILQSKLLHTGTLGMSVQCQTSLQQLSSAVVLPERHRWIRGESRGVVSALHHDSQPEQSSFDARVCRQGNFTYT